MGGCVGVELKNTMQNLRFDEAYWLNLRLSGFSEGPFGGR
jgi:hypothetical protein